MRLAASVLALLSVGWLLSRRITWCFSQPTVDHLRDTIRKADREEIRRREALIDRGAA